MKKTCRTCRYNKKCLESDRGYPCRSYEQYIPVWVRARKEQEEMDDAELEEMEEADNHKLTPLDAAIGLMLFTVAPICCGLSELILRLW